MTRISHLKTVVDVEYRSLKIEPLISEADRRIRLAVWRGKPNLRQCRLAEHVLAVPDAQVGSIPGVAVMLEDAQAAPACGLGRHV